MALSSARPRTTALTRRELMVASTHADGWSMELIARAFGIDPDTCAEYIRRARAKYARQGRDAGTKIALGKRIDEDMAAAEHGHHAKAG